MGSNKVESCALENICNIFQTSPPNVQARLLLWMFEVTSCASNTSIAILLRSNSVSCGFPQHRQTRFVVIAIAMSLSTTLWSVQEHTVDCTDTCGVVFTHRKGSGLSWQLPLRDVRGPTVPFLADRFWNLGW